MASPNLKESQMDNAHQVTTAVTPEQLQEILDLWAREALKELLRQHLERITQPRSDGH
jgi:hypothetical protein